MHRPAIVVLLCVLVRDVRLRVKVWHDGSTSGGDTDLRPGCTSWMYVLDVRLGSTSDGVTDVRPGCTSWIYVYLAELVLALSVLSQNWF